MSSEHKQDMSAIHVWFHVQSALLGVIFLSSLFLNTLLILILRKMKSRRSNKDCASYNIERSYMYLLFHLALADMLGVILNIPFDIFNNAGVVFYFNDIGCKILPPFQLASTTAQAGTYVALSYHRFRAIVHPIRARLTVYKSLIMIAIIWFVGTCLSLPYTIVNRFNATSNTCAERWKEGSATIYTFSIFVVQYAAPVILMAVFYVSIARTLHEHRVAKELIHVPTQEDVRSHKHIVKMLVTIVSVYGVCMLPHHLFWIVTSWERVDKPVYDIISSVSYLFTYSNSVANPLVFFFYNKESRYHLKRFLKKLFCSRTIDVPFEIKKWSATWSGASRTDSQRPIDNRRNSKDLLKLDQLFPPRPGDSELGVSLPWEAQVLSSHASSESYRDYPSSPPFPGVTISPEDSLEYTNYTTNPFVYAGGLHDMNPSEATLDTVHENEENGMDNDACAEDVSGWCEDDNSGEETEGCDPNNCENRNEGSVASSKECLEERESDNDQKEELGNEDDEETPWDEEETDIASDEDDTTRVQHMIERMMRDIRHELKQDGSMNGMRKLDDILNLNESSSNGEWDIINNGESVNDSLAHLGSQDLPGYQGNAKDINELREHLKTLPETRM